MGDTKSKLPDIKEISSMASKFIKDIQKSLTEIVCDYKKKRSEETKPTRPAAKTEAKPSTEKEPVAKTTRSKPKKTEDTK